MGMPAMIMLWLAWLVLGGCLETGTVSAQPPGEIGPNASAADESAAPGRDIRVVHDDRLADPFSQGRKWAVVIGINEYLDPAVPSLRYCVADARLVADALVSRCGYEAERILLMTDDQQKKHLLPLRTNLLEQIPAWLSNAGPKDTVVVFFAGHGFLDQRDQGYLAPMDCKKASLGLTGYRTDDLRNALQQCAARQKLLILDCCHAGAERAGNLAGASSEEVGAAFREAKGLVTLASCGKDQRSCEWEEKRHGLFTHFLAEGLQGNADFDRNGLVDSDELYRFTYDKVSTTAQRDLNVGQRPVRFISPDVEGVLVVARLDMSSVGTTSTKTADSIGMKFVLIPAGEFSMGSPTGQGYPNEHPPHAVRISHSFHLAATEVTQGQYEAVMGQNPSWFSAARLKGNAPSSVDASRLPVERVSFEDALEFCRRLSQKEGLREGSYRLPTEAEWEYAARAGTTGQFGPARDATELAHFACLHDNSAGQTREVGKLRPNAWGLYDMNGNVAEWCADWFDAAYYAKSPAEDPQGPENGGKEAFRVVRGGSWNDDAELCRPADRDGAPPDARENCYGFRVVRCQ